METILPSLSNTRRIHWPLIAGLYIAVFGIIAGVIHFIPKDQIVEPLKTWVPWNLKINFLALIGGVILCWQDIAGAFRRLFDRRGVVLLALIIAGFLMTCFVTERTHRIYFDEDIYANIGQNIATVDQTGFTNYGTFEYGEYQPQWIEYNKEPSGWPFLISLPFQFLGVNELYAFLLTNLLFAGSILLVYLIAWGLTERWFASILAALVYTLIPHNLIWFNTIAAEPSAAFFAGLVALAFIVWIRTGRTRHLFLLALISPMACQMRPESMLIVFWAIIGVLLFRPGVFFEKETWAIGLISLIFLMPHLLHFYAVSGYSWGAEGPKFALSFFLPNLKVNGLYYLNNLKFPALFTFLALVGLFLSKEAPLRWRLLLLLWFCFFWGIFLFFYAGSYQYGADVRFSLVTFIPLAVLAGMGAYLLFDLISKKAGEAKSAALVVALTAVVFIGFLPIVRMEGQEAWGARYDHKFAKQFIEAIPRRSIILTQIPTMFFLWGQSAIQTSAGVNQPDLIRSLMDKYQGNVYFHFNFWCNADSKENVSLCQKIGEMYNVEEVVSAHEQNYEYGLYKLKLK